MPTLHRFERVILAWSLIAVVAIGPLSANKLETKRPRPTNSVTTIVVPKGTQTVTLSWGVTPAVLPDREWNCGNGHGGFMDMFAYTPDQWVLNVEDLTNNVNVIHLEGTSVPVTYSCPGGEQPRPAGETGTMQLDVSSSTANGDATFLTAMETTGEVRTSTPGEQALRPIFCEPFTQPVLVGAGVSFPLTSVIFDTACSAPANARRGSALARFNTVKLDDDISCDIHDPQKLLTYLAPSDKTNGIPNYPSPFQRWKDDPNDHFSGVALGDSPQMFVRGLAFGVEPGKKIWLKLIDPPDGSAYVPKDPAPVNDNKDGSAKLYGPDGQHAKTGKVLSVAVDADSRFEVVLEGAKNDAGDNYKVMASTQKPDDNGVFACEAPNACTLSPEITVWKRQYFEQAKMVTQGAFLARDIVGSTEPCSTTNPCEIKLRSVQVDGARVIRPGATLTLMSMGQAVSSVANTPFHEDVVVDTKHSAADLGPVRPDEQTRGIWIVRLTSRPRLNYSGDPDTIRVALDAVAVHDANGAINAFSSNPTVVKALLKDAFIEYADAAPVEWPYVPYVGVATEIEEILLSKRWFQHATPGTNPVAEPYHRLIVSAKRADVNGDCSTSLGRTHREDHGSWRVSVIYEHTLQFGATKTFRSFYNLSPDNGDTRLPTACLDKTVAGLYHRDAATVEQLDVAHEVVHQYAVNTPAAPGVTKGHCNLKEYTDHFICLMNQTWPGNAVDDQINLNGAKLHYLPGGADSEYMDMRKLKEPTQ